MAVELDDLAHKSLYMRLAKNTPRGLMESARSFVKDATNAKSKGRLFMWRLKQLKENAKIKIIYSAMTTEITGDGQFATGLKYIDADGEHTIDMEGAFVHIGQTPNSQMMPLECEKDQFGYVKIGLDGATSVPGLFAAGDITHSAHKQIIIAAGQGAAAALSAVQYLNRMVM